MTRAVMFGIVGVLGQFLTYSGVREEYAHKLSKKMKLEAAEAAANMEDSFEEQDGESDVFF